MSDPALLVVAITQELTRTVQLERALAGLEPTERRLVTLRAFAPADLLDDARRADVEAAVAAADVLILSHILVDETARHLRTLIRGRVSPTATVLVLNSLRPLLLETRLGGFALADALPDLARAAGPLAALGRLFTSDDMTTAIRELRESLPRILAALPPAARPLDTWLRAALYWSEPSPRNLGQLLLMLLDRCGETPGAFAHRYGDADAHPSRGLYHPTCGITSDPADLPRPAAPAATVVVLLMRGTVVSGDTAAADEVIAGLEARGVFAVPCFAESFDYREVIEEVESSFAPDAIISMSGFPLVGGHNRCEPDVVTQFLGARAIPYFTPPGLMTQDTESWEKSRLGLSPMDAAMQVSIHELEGGLEPIPIQGARRGEPKSVLPQRLPRFLARVEGWLRLAKKPNAEKRIALTVFAFPPGKGSVGTAAYLDVMRSVHAILRRLADEGYRVAVPESAESLLERIVEGDDKTAPIHAASLAVGARLNVGDYERLAPESRRAEKMWGAPPGNLDTDGRDLLVHGVDLGQVFVGVQPSFGFEGDPMRLLFEHSASPHHGFIGYYTWLREVFRADAIVHVGTHGALEFMPGKQIGLSASCWPDMLVGDVPNIYLYAINNPAEGTIAKRRGYALTIAHLTPPTETAGLWAELATMREMIDEYRTSDDGDRRRRTALALVEMVRRHHLEADAPPPETEDDQSLGTFVGSLYVALMEIEARRIPVGLHTIGRRPQRAERVELLAACAEHDRPDAGITGLPSLVLRSRGHDPTAVARAARENAPDAVARYRELAALGRDAVAALLEDGVDAATEMVVAAAPAIDRGAARDLMTHLADVDRRLDQGDELGPLVDALAGRYVPPGRGGDPVRSPEVLPTGRNLHALDPGSVPSPGALRQAEHVVALMLERAVATIGRYPRSIGMVLWGLDNIKTHGEGVAQALLLLGVRPVRNSIGRVADVEVIPLEELGRPRIDVLLSTSGIFRDVFGLQLELLDRAVRLVADLDEPGDVNFVRARSRALEAKGFTPERARTRVFSNSPGSYGANVDHMVGLSTWEERGDLARVWATRKGFSYGATGDGERARDVLEELAEWVETTFQNVDSAEVSITDVDHYFEYLGGMTALVEERSGRRPPVLLADATSARVRIRGLEETVRLETRTKLLNPKWYEGLLRHGYEGVEEIRKRFDYTFGWSATCEAVAPWIYREVHRTYVENADVQERMRSANLHAYTSLVARLREADSRGFWEPTAEERALLAETSADVEDALEGLAG